MKKAVRMARPGGKFPRKKFDFYSDYRTLFFDFKVFFIYVALNISTSSYAI